MFCVEAEPRAMWQRLLLPSDEGHRWSIASLMAGIPALRGDEFHSRRWPSRPKLPGPAVVPHSRISPGLANHHPSLAAGDPVVHYMILPTAFLQTEAYPRRVHTAFDEFRHELSANLFYIEGGLELSQ